MSTFEAPYKSLLQGVSQQLPEERLPGQVTSQTNMVSDPVTNLRRRPGVVMRKSWAWEGAEYTHLAGWFTDIAGSRVHILVNTATGKIKILNEDFEEEAELDAGAYLVNDPSRIRAASVGNEFFLCNVDVKPRLRYETYATNPNDSGFFYVAAGAFSKTYEVSLDTADGAITAAYTTPSGAGAGDAAYATPEYIATTLANVLDGTAFTHVRFVSTTISKVGNDGSPVTYGTAALQINTGSAGAPVWSNVVHPSEVTLSTISQGRIRFYASTLDLPPVFGAALTRTAFSAVLRFNVYLTSGWAATLYVTAPVQVFVRGRREESVTIPLTTFTSEVTLGAGNPTLLVERSGPYVFVSRSGGITVNTSSGKNYVVASRSGFVTSAGDLPERLPGAADGFICRVGSERSPQYYQYNAARTEWLEGSAFGSATGISDVPISLTWTGTAWELKAQDFTGALSGDAESNPPHEFMEFGISGMAAHQGRLVLMSGPLVSMSASNRPRDFFRSTVTSLVSSDPIEVGSGMTSAAAYEWAVPFQKDLVLFSRAYQALIPSGNQAITPSTATVVPTSSHETDTTCGPVSAGRTLLYCNPRSEDFFGVLEMLPSNFTDSQYTSQDSTPHLPKYMPGRCRFAVSSGVASLALFAPSGDPRTLVVHEYHWDGDTKVQQAWHQWTFEYPVAQAYFASDMIVLAFVQNGTVVLGTVDPRAGAINAASERRPFLDLNISTAITDHSIPIPEWMLAFDPAIASKLVAVVLSGSLAGERVGTSPSVDGLSLTTVLSWPSGGVGLGLPYYSGVTPGSPVITDYSNEVIHSGKATLLRYLIGTKNSSEFMVDVSDDYSMSDPYSIPTVSWSSPELELGVAPFSKRASVVVPCRTELRSTAMEVYTEGTGELNITSLEYVAKFHAKIKRK